MSGEAFPRRLLRRHFFNAFFDFGFLSDEGSQSVERGLLGSVAVAMGIGLLLLRIFFGKYAELSGSPLEAYRNEVAADHAFLIGLPMWIVAAAVVLVGHALFPDETDFRVLMAEPISRGTIFRAKLEALLRFVGLFAAGAHVALAPLSLLTIVSPLGPGVFPARALAFAVSTAAGSLCAALLVVALHGLMVLLVPRHRQMTTSAAMRSVLVWLLVLSLLFVARLPATSRAFAAHAWWLGLAPPAWFVGLERWLLGDSTMGPLALAGIVATAAAGAVAVGVYAVLYRHFDRAMLRPAETHAAAERSGSRPGRTHAIRRAIEAFISVTLRRSQLHQGIVVALSAAGAGLVVNGFLMAGLPWRGGGTWMIFWGPFVLMFVACPALRLAMSVPMEPRANWIFRMTEDAGARIDVVAAGVRTVFGLGVVMPVAVMIPLQWPTFGLGTLRLVAIELAMGWLLVEILMRGWRRIPFTCGYVPGKGFVPHMFVKGVASFVLFTNVGAQFLGVTTAFPSTAPFVLAFICTPAIVLFILRRRQSFPLGLAFEDDLPSELNVLRLHE